MTVIGWVMFFCTWGLPFIIYLSLQIAAVIRLRGARRLVSIIPMLPMVGVVAVTISAFREQSNLWPILLIIASPFAALFIAVVCLTAPKKNAGTA
jgi:hypothetical protein